MNYAGRTDTRRPTQAACRRFLRAIVGLALIFGCSIQEVPIRARTSQRSVAAQGDDLTLAASNSFLVDSLWSFDGIGVAATEEIFGWARDGRVYFGGRDGWHRRQSVHIEGWTVESVAVDSGSHVSGIATRSGHVGLFTVEAEPLIVATLPGTYRAATFDSGIWSVVLGTLADRVEVARFTMNSKISQPNIRLARRGSTIGRHVSVAVRKSTTVVAAVSDSARIWCYEGRELAASEALALTRLNQAATTMSGSEQWEVAAVLPLGDRFLVALADLRGTSRLAVLLGSSCSIVRVSRMPDLVLPVASSATSNLLVATDFRSSPTVLTFRWRWGAR